MVKNLPAMWDPWVGSLGQDDPLQPTPVVLPGEFHGPRSLAVSTPRRSPPWGGEESDTTEQLNTWLPSVVMVGTDIP